MKIPSLILGEPVPIQEVAEFFELPPSFVIEKARQIYDSLGDDFDTQLKRSVNRFRLEKALDGGRTVGLRWAAASLGLEQTTFEKCLNFPGLALLPIPHGRLITKNPKLPKDNLPIFNLDLLAAWATKVIELLGNFSGTFSNVTSKSIRLRDVLISVGVPDPKLQFCTFETKHLEDLGIDAEDERARTVSSTLCILTRSPIWQGYGCWLDNGKPITMSPDLVSYQVLLENKIPTDILDRGSYQRFLELTEDWGHYGIQAKVGH